MRLKIAARDQSGDHGPRRKVRLKYTFASFHLFLFFTTTVRMLLTPLFHSFPEIRNFEREHRIANKKKHTRGTYTKCGIEQAIGLTLRGARHVLGLPRPSRDWYHFQRGTVGSAARTPPGGLRATPTRCRSSRVRRRGCSSLSWLHRC